MTRRHALITALILAAGAAGCAHRVEPQLSQAVLDARAKRDVPADVCASVPSQPAGPTAVQFPFGESSLGLAAQRQVDAAVTLLSCQPQMRAAVRGVADGHGSAAAQADLANQRARAVIAYLTNKGVAAARLSLLSPDAADPPAGTLLISAEGQRW